MPEIQPAPCNPASSDRFVSAGMNSGAQMRSGRGADTLSHAFAVYPIPAANQDADPFLQGPCGRRATRLSEPCQCFNDERLGQLPRRDWVKIACPLE